MSRLPALCVLLLVATTAPADVGLLVVAGLGGEETYSESFDAWSHDLLAAAYAAGLRDDDIRYLAESDERGGPEADGVSTRDAFLATLTDWAGRFADGDRLWIVYFGHGSARGSDLRLHLPGPDLTLEELAVAIDGLSAGEVVFVNAGSSSGDFAKRLAGENRLIVTATRSSGEHMMPVFGEYFSQGFVDLQADTDKDGRVSLLEAFDFARLEVEKFYQREGRMQTEHALLESDGDAVGSRAPERDGGDGLRASQAFLAATVDLGLPAEQGRRKAELEKQIAALRAQRENLEEDLYFEELERLLVELAELDESARAPGSDG